MSRSDTNQGSDGQALSQPAIGIDATEYEGSPGALRETVADATQHASTVFVAVTAGESTVSQQVTANATIVEVPPDVDTDNALIQAGKERGLPGVILHPSAGSAAALDYDASYEAFQRSNQYLLPARLDEPGRGQIVTGIIGSEYSQRHLQELVAEAQAAADAVVVVADAFADASEIQDAEAVTVVPPDRKTTPIRTCIDAVRNHDANIDAFVLLGPAATQDALSTLPALTHPLSERATDIVVSQRPPGECTHSSGAQTPGEPASGRPAIAHPATREANWTDRTLSFSETALEQLARTDSADLERAELFEAMAWADLEVSVAGESEPAPTTPAEAARQDVASTDQRPEQHHDTVAAAASTRSASVATNGATPPATDTDGPQDPMDLLVGPTDATAPVLSVVIPTMNEEEGIGTCLEWVHEAIASLGVPAEIIISDSSTDRTPEIAREYGATVVEPDEPGYGYAYRYAFEQARGEYIAMGDADTTYDFSEIPRLLDHLQDSDADMVMGSRFDGEIKPGAMPPLHKYVGNPLLTTFLNVFYDTDVSDAHSGFRVFRADALEALSLDSDGMEFASEMIMEASVTGLTIEEVPITYHDRVGEETLDSFRDGWRHVRFMLVNAPGQLFTVPAGLTLGVGLLILALSWLSVDLGEITFSVHTAIAGGFLTITGFQLGMLGVFSTIAADPVKTPTDRVSQWVVENVHLEHGVLAGIGLAVVGGGYTVSMVGRWLATGSVPLVAPNMLAFTAIVIGLQTVFYSFFLSVLATSR